MEKDFYKVLGIAKDAPADDVKKAYRRLARDLHPDHNPNDPESEERFKEVSEAYSVLADPKQRKEYDEMRSLMGAGAFRRGARMGGGQAPFDFDDLMRQARGGGFSQQQGGGGLGDLFGSFFGGGRQRGPAKGRDVETSVTLDFTDAVYGVTLPLKLRSPGACDTCGGSGAKPGTSPRTCPVCHGAGVRSVDQGAFSFSEPCRECNGVGSIVTDPCPECQGTGGVTKTRVLTVRIPPGVRDGQRIRLAGRGEVGERGGAAGDLFVLVHVRPHELFTREDDDLLLTLPVSFTEATLGADVRVPTLNGPVTVRVPAGTPSGRVLRVRGRGVPFRTPGSDGAGDLLVTISVTVPTSLSPEAEAALRSYAEAEPRAPRDRIDDAVGPVADPA